MLTRLPIKTDQKHMHIAMLLVSVDHFGEERDFSRKDLILTLYP